MQKRNWIMQNDSIDLLFSDKKRLFKEVFVKLAYVVFD